jgi:hypothetical protein
VLQDYDYHVNYLVNFCPSTFGLVRAAIEAAWVLVGPIEQGRAAAPLALPVLWTPCVK